MAKKGTNERKEMFRETEQEQLSNYSDKNQTKTKENTIGWKNTYPGPTAVQSLSCPPIWSLSCVL